MSGHLEGSTDGPTGGQTAAKRKNSYYQQNAKKAKQNKGLLTEGMTGFIATCNLKEFYCLKEAYNLLNEFADKLYGKYNQQNTDKETDDIESAIQSEINSLKSSEKRFQQVMTKCNNVLFIKSNDISVEPLVMCSEIFEEIKTNGKQITRHLLRLLPVLTTLKVNSDFDQILERYLERETKEPISYCIQCKVRNNSEVRRMDVIEKAVAVVKRVRPEWKVDFDAPKLIVDFEVLHKTICLSFLNDYQCYCKYNLIEFSKKCLNQINDKNDSKV